MICSYQVLFGSPQIYMSPLYIVLCILGHKVSQKMQQTTDFIIFVTSCDMYFKIRVCQHGKNEIKNGNNTVLE
jgi:hypothetical protein